MLKYLRRTSVKPHPPRNHYFKQKLATFDFYFVWVYNRCIILRSSIIQLNIKGSNYLLNSLNFYVKNNLS